MLMVYSVAFCRYVHLFCLFCCFNLKVNHVMYVFGCVLWFVFTMYIAQNININKPWSLVYLNIKYDFREKHRNTFVRLLKGFNDNVKLIKYGRVSCVLKYSNSFDTEILKVYAACIQVPVFATGAWELDYNHPPTNPFISKYCLCVFCRYFQHI